jgi:hypothetical protein
MCLSSNSTPEVKPVRALQEPVAPAEVDLSAEDDTDLDVKKKRGTSRFQIALAQQSKSANNLASIG